MFSSFDDSIAPKDFITLCAPAWARVYIELSYGRDPSQDRLAFDGDLVRKTFTSLTGFDPARLQYGLFQQQHAALNVARELDAALYVADEVVQLDGSPALQYAAGWISAYSWLEFADKSAYPAEDDIFREARKASSISHEKSTFVDGFVYRAKLNGTYVA